MAVLLGLPNEALLRIFHYLLQSVKHPKPQADLLSLILTCKRLAPLVREVLFTTPILHPCKIDIFLTTLFKYPDLQSKIQSLALESNKIHRSWVISDPARVRGQDAEISSKCAGILHTLKLDEEVKQECIHVLQGKSGWLGNLISLVLILLPNLSSLYLGGTPLSYVNFLQPVLDQNLDLYQKFSRSDHIRISSQVSAKLTFLELPRGLQLCGEAKGSLPTFFPELRHLILPYSSVIGTTPGGITPQYIIPPKLETLVLIGCSKYADVWLNKVTLAHGTCFPSLHSLSTYSRGFLTQYPLLLRDEMKRLGITCKSFLYPSHVTYSTVAHGTFLLTSDVFNDGSVYEYVPKEDSWPLYELHHPWLYTRVELDAFMSMRCREEMERSKRGEWEVEESEGEE